MNEMNREERVKVETLVLRLWREGDHRGRGGWRGSLIHPEAEKQVHFRTLHGLDEKINELLREIGSGEKGGDAD